LSYKRKEVRGHQTELSEFNILSSKGEKSMDTELIMQIANEIVTEKILHNWEFYVIIFVLFFLSSFVRSYLTGRGKQYARKSDIDAILDELKKTTRATEEIKSNIEKGVWIKIDMTPLTVLQQFINCTFPNWIKRWLLCMTHMQFS